MGFIARKNLQLEEWLGDQYVTRNNDYIRLKSGFWHTELKLPITPDLRTCYASHGIYAPFKYEKLFNSLEWIKSLDQSLPEISNGILHTGSASHFHYLVDGIGNLSAEALKESDKIFVDFDFSDDQVAFLDEAIYSISRKKLRIIRVPAGTYLVKDVILPMVKQYPIRVHSVRKYIKPFSEPSKKSSQRIYITRRKAGTRHLVNENEFLGEISRKYEFEIIENENFSLLEQLRIYLNAEFIVGPHGAGLTNVLFSESPKGLLEFWHSVKQPFFHDLSRTLGISYLEVTGVSLPGPSKTWRKDDTHFTVDPVRALREIEALVKNS